MYTKIDELIWKDDKFKELSDDAKLLFFYVLTGPHRNMLGFYFLPVPYGSFDLGWSAQRYEKGLKELLDKGMIKYNYNTNVIFVKNFLKYNPLENQNQVKGAINALNKIPANGIDKDLQDLVKGLDKEYYQPLMELLKKRLSKGFAQQEEQEQSEEQEQDERTPTDIPPYGEIQKTFNLICKSLPKVEKISESRKQKIKTRWSEWQTMEYVERLFNKVEQSSFLKGDNVKNWKCTFDWLIENDKNHIKVLEGNYDGKSDNISQPHGRMLEGGGAML